MGWANSIARACTLIVLLVAVFALTACGNGGQDPAAPAPEPRRVDPSVEEFLDQVDVTELEREYRAQIEHVLGVGLRPTHLDSHCAIHTRREGIFEMTLGLARQYGVPLRAYYRPYIDKMRRRGYPANDHELMDSYDLDTVGKAARYERMLRALPVGLSEWAVHPGIGNAELRAVEPSWRVRQTDLDFVVSQEAQTILQEEGIILVNYRALRALWNEKPPRA